MRLVFDYADGSSVSEEVFPETMITLAREAQHIRSDRTFNETRPATSRTFSAADLVSVRIEDALQDIAADVDRDRRIAALEGELGVPRAAS